MTYLLNMQTEYFGDAPSIDYSLFQAHCPFHMRCGNVRYPYV
ncbi:hypothetical protein SAMN02745903_01838 [Pseudomonas sp. URMO17WK12:I5]|nr:hypothetical protein H040_01903 [Pseudomonas sp. URMO17WK12:I7]SMF17060.1 hypothetical protein SAMN02745903_01838 [Pseudomonas sp. URMO17WK12:I5]